MKSGIYKISFIGSEKFYIGSAVNLSRRKCNHLSDLRKERHPNIIMLRLYKKHGESNFIFDVVEYVKDETNLISREQFYIDTLKPEINILKQAKSSLGYSHTVESKEKFKVIAKERANNPEWLSKVKNTWFKQGKRSLSESERNRLIEHGKVCFKGKRHTEESKLLMSE